MAFIPPGDHWYIAELILEINVAGAAVNVVQTSTVLLRAATPEAAYARALALGGQHDQHYRNSADAAVQVQFVGLGELRVVYDELEDGAELYSSERIGVSPTRLRRLVRKQARLAVFRSDAPAQSPNYTPRELVEQLTGQPGTPEITA